jgi:hypothetical protein
MKTSHQFALHGIIKVKYVFYLNHDRNSYMHIYMKFIYIFCLAFLCPNFGHNLQKIPDRLLVYLQSFLSKSSHLVTSKIDFISIGYLLFFLANQS